MSRNGVMPVAFTAQADLFVLPRYTFAGASLETGQLSALRDYIWRSAAYRSAPDNAEPLDEDALTVVEDLRSYQEGWVKDYLGLSLADRPFRPERIRWLHRERGVVPDRQARGFTTRVTDETVCLLGRDEQENLMVLGHEMVHLLAGKALKLEIMKVEGVRLFLVGHGYAQCLDPVVAARKPWPVTESGPVHLEALNEAVTDLWNAEMLQSYLLARGVVYPEPPEVAYGTLVLLLDLLITEAGRRLGRSNSTLRHQLYQGYLRADLSALTFLERAFGPRVLVLLAGLSPHYEGNEEGVRGAIAVADRVGLGNRLRRTFAECLATERATILDGIEVRPFLR